MSAFFPVYVYVSLCDVCKYVTLVALKAFEEVHVKQQQCQFPEIMEKNNVWALDFSSMISKLSALN